MAHLSKHEGPVDPLTNSSPLTQDQFMARCRAVKVADALALITEAKVLDREENVISDHLEIAMTALLDALSVLSERASS
jgi:hypothetical protein